MFFFWFFWIPQTLATPKMIITFGKPVNYTDYDVISTDYDSCLSICYEKEDCVLSHFSPPSTCLNFKPNGNLKIQKMDSTSESTVAFKARDDLDFSRDDLDFSRDDLDFSRDDLDSIFQRNLTSCPSSSDPPTFGSISVQETYSSDTITYQYTIKKIRDAAGNTYWNFTFGHLTQCNTTSYILVRGNSTVCVELRLFPSPYCGTQAEATSLCKENNGISLTGSYSTTENTFFQAYMNRTFTRMEYGRTFTYLDLWVDGVYNNSQYNWSDTSLQNLDSYDWESVSRNGGQGPCTYFVMETPMARSRGCDSSSSGTLFCFRGAACRVKPILEY